MTFGIFVNIQFTLREAEGCSHQVTVLHAPNINANSSYSDSRTIPVVHKDAALMQ